jgi:glyoxylase-like metal-dependent hydrolase (beta-lactamase superfamily II)
VPTVLNAGNRGPFTLDGTRSFLIGRREVAVIDPGPDDEEHVRALLSLLGEASKSRILLTHHHADHAGGAQSLAEALGVPAEGPPSAGFEVLSPGDTISPDEG